MNVVLNGETTARSERRRKIADLVAARDTRALRDMGINGAHGTDGGWTGYDYRDQQWYTVAGPGPVGGT